MQVKNRITPNAEQMAGFGEPGPAGPIYMVNLLKFKEKAEYADGRETSLSGADAYGLYAAGVTKLLTGLGGAMVFKAPVERLMLGEVEELWDVVAIAVYPSRAAMFEMMRSAGMQELAVHRQAGLAGQLNIECADASGLWIDAGRG